MCVRSSVGNESVEVILPSSSNAKKTQSDRLTRIKEKYIKVHDDMLDREKQELLRQQQQERASYHVSDLADHVLAVSTIHYSLLLQKMAKYYKIVSRTKAFK